MLVWCSQRDLLDSQDNSLLRQENPKTTHNKYMGQLYPLLLIKVIVHKSNSFQTEDFVMKFS